MKTGTKSSPSQRDIDLERKWTILAEKIDAGDMILQK